MIGTVAGVLTTCAFLPQVIKVLKTKETSSISLVMYCVSVTGLCLWIIHGLMIKDAAVLLANSFTLLLSSIILICQIKYK